jgi:hypothetical protein
MVCGVKTPRCDARRDSNPSLCRKCAHEEPLDEAHALHESKGRARRPSRRLSTLAARTVKHCTIGVHPESREQPLRVGQTGTAA